MSIRLNLPRFHLTTQTTPHKWVNTGYWQQPNPDDSPVEQVATSPTKKKKANRNRKKRLNQTEHAPRQTTWTTEEEIALAKGWRSVFENSERDNARKKDGFWVEVLEYVECKTKQEGHRTYDMMVGKWKVSQISRDSISNFNQGSQGSSKRHKSSGSSSFNAESGDANTVDDEDDVPEIRRPHGKNKAKNKGSKASGSSTMNDDALARLMVTEMKAAEVAQREKFMELKRREVECREREIAAAEYRAQQEDMKLYLQPYEHLTGEQRLQWMQ
ncbi:hypothetical protein Tco_0710253 [Tanacetum coccineum]